MGVHVVCDEPGRSNRVVALDCDVCPCRGGEHIPYAIEAAARDTHTDAEAIFNAHRVVATALVSVPNRYMHSPNEMITVEDLDRTTHLLAAFVRRLTPDVDFVPR